MSTPNPPTPQAGNTHASASNPFPISARRALRLLGLGLIATVSRGCHHAPCPGDSNSSKAPDEALIQVWTQPGWPPLQLPAPPGFNTTPFEAFHAVARSKRLSLKHDWFCYRDQQCYYIADAFGQRPSAKIARRTGVVVNGQTGAVTEPDP